MGEKPVSEMGEKTYTAEAKRNHTNRELKYMYDRARLLEPLSDSDSADSDSSDSDISDEDEEPAEELPPPGELLTPQAEGNEDASDGEPSSGESEDVSEEEEDTSESEEGLRRRRNQWAPTLCPHCFTEREPCASVATSSAEGQCKKIRGSTTRRVFSSSPGEDDMEMDFIFCLNLSYYNYEY